MITATVSSEGNTHLELRRGMRVQIADGGVYKVARVRGCTLTLKDLSTLDRMRDALNALPLWNRMLGIVLSILSIASSISIVIHAFQGKF